MCKREGKKLEPPSEQASSHLLRYVRSRHEASSEGSVSSSGREARETVKIINKEEQEFHFAFQDTSRYSEGFSNSLVVCPMEGWVPPLSR